MSEADRVEFVITSLGENAETLRDELATVADPEVDLRLEVRQVPPRYRGADPTILIAIVSVIGTSCGALVAGLLQLAQSRQARTIVLAGRDGSRLEIPSDLPLEQIDELLARVRQMGGGSASIV